MLSITELTLSTAFHWCVYCNYSEHPLMTPPAPPTNQSAFDQWTVGAVYFSAMIMAEAFGKTNTSQIIDMMGNNGDIHTPQYAIFENGILAKVALFNFMTDPTHASDYTAVLHLNGGQVPAQVHVKYALAYSLPSGADSNCCVDT